MRVGIVTEWFSRGAGYVSRQYRDVLQAQGWDVSIYSRGDMHIERDAEWRDTNVHIASPCRIGKPKAILASDYLAWLHRIQPEVVIFNEQHWLPPVLWTREAGVKTAAYVDFYTFRNLWSFEWYDALICNTKRHAGVFGWHLGSHYIPWGTDVSRYRPAVRHERPVTFLHSAGWDPLRKGTEIVLRSWLALPLGTRLVLHSQVDIASLLSRYPCADAVARGDLLVLSGTLPPEELYPLGDIYVYPTHLEGIGLTVPEAIASGLPVIVPDDGPMSEFCLDGVSVRVPIARRYRRNDGYFWPCNDVDDSDLTEAMAGFVGADTWEVEQWRTACRESALNHFDWSANAASLGDLLRTTAVRDVDRTIAGAAGRVHPTLAKATSVAGNVAARAFGARLVR